MSASRDSITDIWGGRTPYFEHWPERVDHRLDEEPERWVPSACVLCSNGCALDIGVKDNKIVGVRGRAVDRVNRGRLGPKGLNGWVANHSPDRLTQPLVRVDGKLMPATWDEAMELIVLKSRESIQHYTGNSIGFYTSGQLFLEEYYALAVIGKAGIGTPHMDGNTRLCTATAAAALKETYGSDGQTGSFADIDITDALFLMGNNIAETQTVMWMRMLDRRRGPNPPKLVVVDPRTTATAQEADVHLAPRVGTNVALLNGLQNLLIQNGHIDQDFIDKHTLGFDQLKEMVAKWTPERVEEVSGVPAHKLRAAAEILGTSKTLLCTVLQGVYQSNQATAAAVQVNNLNLIRGLSGKPGCGVLQMNGQPTAQNTRECGADGDLPAFRNWDNPDHIKQLVTLWNVKPEQIPGWKPPTHALEMFRLCEKGSIKLLWISATNPAVSIPNLHRMRAILGREDLFVVVQDAFLTETAKQADVVLPAAIWGEKTGCFTNIDRTVHISHKAVEPPGQARSDLDIFLDYARRMDFRDQDGQPLIKWKTPEDVFNGWRECTRGRLCDYSGMSYEKLSRGSGIQWPCNAQNPEGTPRLYTDHEFPTHYEAAESFGHDLVTGAAVQPQEYKVMNPNGRAFLKAADYQPPHEQPDEEYPLILTTGRLVYHFHTRTKTGRSRALEDAAPDAFVEVSDVDAQRLGLQGGDLVAVESRRGRAHVPVRVADIDPGHLFIPFHYGYWDDDSGRPRAANELTLYDWDPVSKQPHYKYAAVRLRKLMREEFEAAVPGGREPDEALKPSKKKPRAHVADYLGLLHGSEQAVAEALEKISEVHKAEPDIHSICKLLASYSREHVKDIKPIIDRYGKVTESEPDRLRKALFPQFRKGAIGLVRDLHDVYLLTHEAHMSQEILQQAAKALRDDELIELLMRLTQHNHRQRAWLNTRIKQSAPQSLVVPS
jgi:ferredoxin-nitrate reductase